MLPIPRGRDLVELSRAGQFKRAVARDVPTNRDKFVAGRSERHPTTAPFVTGRPCRSTTRPVYVYGARVSQPAMTMAAAKHAESL